MQCQKLVSYDAEAQFGEICPRDAEGEPMAIGVELGGTVHQFIVHVCPFHRTLTTFDAVTAPGVAKS